MSLSVQGAAGALFSQRTAGLTRPASERLDSDVDRDAWARADPKLAPNRYDQAIDSLRLAALRRDAALAATAKARKTDHAELRREREDPG